MKYEGVKLPPPPPEKTTLKKPSLITVKMHGSRYLPIIEH